MRKEIPCRLITCSTNSAGAIGARRYLIPSSDVALRGLARKDVTVIQVRAGFGLKL